MAVLHVEAMSQELRRAVPMWVVLPSDKMESYGGARDERGPYKTLYLLHGLLGNCSDWLTNTNVRRLAEERNLAVVMPSGDNSFYVDQLLPNNDYGAYIGREIVELTRRMFPLSPRREDTFIAGLSMGGFGALRNGLVHYGTFGRIAVLSGVLQIFEEPADAPAHSLFHEDAVFGDVGVAELTDKNPRVALRRMVEQCGGDAALYPRVYMACGEQDGLLGVNHRVRDFLREGGVDVTWHEAPGGHGWDFWRAELVRVLDWLPLDKAATGIDSGNVSI